MVVNRSAAPGPVFPTLVYQDVGKAIDWLCEIFGFAERFRYGPTENPAGAQLAAGEPDGGPTGGFFRDGHPLPW